MYQRLFCLTTSLTCDRFRLVLVSRYSVAVPCHSGVRPPVRRRENRVLCEDVKSFPWSLFKYVATDPASPPHPRAQWWRITASAAPKSTDAADCGNHDGDSFKKVGVTAQIQVLQLQTSPRSEPTGPNSNKISCSHPPSYTLQCNWHNPKPWL